MSDAKRVSGERLRIMVVPACAADFWEAVRKIGPETRTPTVVLKDMGEIKLGTLTLFLGLNFEGLTKYLATRAHDEVPQSLSNMIAAWKTPVAFQRFREMSTGLPIVITGRAHDMELARRFPQKLGAPRDAVLGLYDYNV